MADHEDELLEAVRELTRTVDELRTELESSARRPRTGPGRLQPPTPRELLAFADEVALPAAIAVLEANVRALKAFQRALAATRTEREVRDRTADAAAVTTDRARDLRATTLSHLDTVLSQLERTVDDDAADDRASELLREARNLRDEVDNRLRTADQASSADVDRDGGSKSVRIDIEEGPLEDAERDPDARVDVDAELETLKDRYGADEDASDAGTDADDDESDNGDADPDETDGENGV